MASQKKQEKSDKKVSVTPKNESDIQPVLYSFRVMGGGLESGSVMTAIRPPYWVYHDHALGVIWSLFHSDKNYIGITQLHWCLRFLLDLKNSQGEYTGDVEICIRVIQDDLIEQYAKLGTAIEKSLDDKSKEDDKDDHPAEKQTVSKIPEESAKEVEAAKETHHETEPIIAQQTETTDKATDNQQKIDDFIDAEQRDPQQTSSFISSSGPGPSGIGRAKDKTRMAGEPCDQNKCGVAERRKKKEETISLTYNEMVSRGPAPCAEQDSIIDFFDESEFIETSDTKMTEHTKDSEDRTADESTKEMVHFLNSAMEEHIDRIKKEIDSLYGLKKFIENLSDSGFPAHITQDLSKKMERLNTEKISRET